MVKLEHRPLLLDREAGRCDGTVEPGDAEPRQRVLRAKVSTLCLTGVSPPNPGVSEKDSEMEPETWV